jgi:pyruvate/2-oxoglutarate dehydrogenase complex dihydrolipoamide acyltransferase (E2) component
MQVEVVMPKMGESIMEGKILRWAKKVGDKIAKDETILEISTDKVDSEIPSPVAGILARIVVQEQETVPVGTVIAFVETDAAAKIDTSHPVPPVVSSGAAAPIVPNTTVASQQVVHAELPSRFGNDRRFYSPLVRTIAKNEGILKQELDALPGSGAGGRVTKLDILDYLKARAAQPASLLPHRHESLIQKPDIAQLQKKYPAPRYHIQQMDNVQQKMAEHMVRSVATSPHVSAIDEVDVTALVNYRTKSAAAFEKQEGFKLTFTPLFGFAVVQTLKEFPLLNTSVEGDKIVFKNFVNLGMAVASPTGLIVPNVQNADHKNFIGLARAINDISLRTRNKKLLPDEILGGTFTISNYGVFGNIIGIPIINQPQVAILGIGAIKKRPMVLSDPDGNDMIGIRSMVYLTMSFDHRIIDGAIGGQFLAKVKWNLENFDFSKEL